MHPLLLIPALVQVASTAPTGHWAGTLQVPGMVMDFQVQLVEGKPWRGTLTLREQHMVDHPLVDITVEEKRVSFRLKDIPGNPTFRGTLEADGTIQGTFSQGGGSFPFQMKREVPKTTPDPSSPDREVAFTGWQGAPLKGSVRPAKGHAYMAVLVAGSGPTDRNWSNPLLRDPATGKAMKSHGGRDFAEWLAKQGIPSLRYDKRFLGSNNPKLDISLEAQSGDVQAAVAFARSLPEAKGRKLLLIGHSEGSLLSLRVAKEADALLMLCAPHQSMAKTVREQVVHQLPPDAAAPNLAHLDAVFEAIRQGQPAPVPGPKVLPGIVSLGASFSTPVNLAFSRGILDLEPWPLAAKLTIPCAVAWGDRDVQTWKPATLPANFPGKVLELKGANHLLKQERHTPEALRAGLAAVSYGDDTPMADLSPLAGWLAGLKS